MNCKIVAVMICTLLLAGGINSGAAESTATPQISGEIVNGLRLLPLMAGGQNNFVIYRGDYMQPVIAGVAGFVMEIPDLQVRQQFPANKGEKAYIKMNKTGTYAFTAGAVSGTIQVVDYAAAAYLELSAEAADKLLQNTRPLILDVRTKDEFQQGYIPGATLLPVQQLQQNIAELQPYKNQDVFIYCASGNRSTVASRMLIENGFKKIYNLRYGFSDWVQRGYPIVR